MELKPSVKKYYGTSISAPPLPILCESPSGFCVDDYEWSIHTGWFNGISVIIDDPHDISSLVNKGCFGKGSLSKGCPLSSKRKFPDNVVHESQWKRRKIWMEKLDNLLCNKVSNNIEIPEIKSLSELEYKNANDQKDNSDNVLIDPDNLNLKVNPNDVESEKEVKINDVEAEKEVKTNNVEAEKEVETNDVEAEIEVKTNDVEAEKENKKCKDKEVELHDDRSVKMYDVNEVKLCDVKELKISVDRLVEMCDDKEVKMCVERDVTQIKSTIRLESKNGHDQKDQTDSEKVVESQELESEKEVEVLFNNVLSDSDVTSNDNVHINRTSNEELKKSNENLLHIKNTFSKHTEADNEESLYKNSSSNKTVIRKLSAREILVISDISDDLEHYFSDLNPRIEEEKVKTAIEVLHLSLEEAFFLSYACNCLNVVDLGFKKLLINDMWNKFQKSQSDFIEKYVAYHYFRAKGWVVKSGIKYGGDFLLYNKGPHLFHASYIVIVQLIKNGKCVKNNKTWDKVMKITRTAKSSLKDVIFLNVIWPEVEDNTFNDPSILKSIKVNETLLRRWQATREKSSLTDGEESE